MKYFFPTDKSLPCYHYLHKGHFDDNDYGNELKYLDSIVFDDYMMEETLIYKAFKAVLKDYDYYGITKVLPSEWALICEYAKTHLGSEAQEAIFEIENWTKKVFENEGFFTISGI